MKKKGREVKVVVASVHLNIVCAMNWKSAYSRD